MWKCILPVFSRLFFKLYHELLELSVWILLLLCFAFFALSWSFFWLAGETDLTANVVTFVYFAATTASTVGYGDFSPQTNAGKLVAAFWFFPGALLIFSAALGRLAGSMVERIRRMADGHGNYERMNGATVIVGYHREQTPLMVENLVAGDDGDDKIVLLTTVTDADVPEGVYLVKSDRLDALAPLKRAGIPKAQKALVCAGSDAETFNTCLAIRELNETVHVAAFFEDRDTAHRASRIAGVETVVANTSEALVRAAQDPGSGQILMALSAANVGATIYSAQTQNPLEVATLQQALTALNATLIAVSQPDESDYSFCPYPALLRANGAFYYLSKARLTSKAIHAAAGGGDVSIVV